MGGVVSNAQKEEETEGKKPGTSSHHIPFKTLTPVVKVEARQPLSSRTNGTTQTRPIAPVPARAKVPVYANTEIPVPEEDEEIISEMDVDVKREPAVTEREFILDDDASSGEMSEDEEDEDEEDWTRMTEDEIIEAREQLEMVKASFHDEVDMFDTTMVAEYAEDIFHHMEVLEQEVMPNPRYMNFQTEIEW